MIQSERLNELAKLAAQDSKAHGFCDQDKPVWRTFVKACCEIAEAIDAYRDRRNAGMTSFINAQTLSSSMIYGEKLRNKIYAKEYDQFVKNTVQDELADVLIYLLVAAGNVGADLTVPERWTGIEMAQMEAYFESADFVTIAGRLMQLLLKQDNLLEPDRGIDLWSKIIKAIDFITLWVRFEFDQDIEYWVNSKMQYNRIRPYRHGRKNDPTL